MTGMLGEPARRFLEGEAFEADAFQIEAIRSIERGASVVVTAPTGSGKTLIAEAALEIALAAGRRAFYTAPIKALSNQKYRDLVSRYGESGTGLLTGDNTINGDAPVVVMTTEVLRNMIYEESSSLDGLGVVILDEVHYLQDRYRGSVWEEIIIHLPSGIQLVNLSATIANPEEFTGWIRARRGTTDLVVETHRPVPLESMYLLRDRHHGNVVEWFPVFDRTGTKPNGHVRNLLRKGRGRHRRFATPRRLEVAEALLGAAKLPAIYFIFSRAGCEDAARTVATSGLRLTSADERQIIRAHAVEAVGHLDPVDLGILGYESWLAMLETGIAAHHAGMVPSFKETVEELFAAGLVKLVFATETLSLGINMPAKAVVLESFSKFNGESHELLRAGDYTQLTGRAGRRGIDERGTALVLHSSYVPFDKIADVAGMGSHPLVSSFEPSYNMAVNLTANYSRDRAEELLRASFAQFRAQERVRILEDRIEERSREAAEFLAAAQCKRGDIEVFAAAASDEESGGDALREFFTRLDAGDVLDLGDGERWLILARGYGKNPKFHLLSEDGGDQRRTANSLGSSVLLLGRLDLEEPVRSIDPSYRASTAVALRRWTPTTDPAGPMGPGGADAGVAGCPKLDEHLQWLARSRRSSKDVRRLRRRKKRSGDDVVERFRARMSILEHFDYVAAWELSAKGHSLRRVYNELDLLLSEAIERGLLDGLTVPEFTAVVSLFTYEARARDPEAERLVGAVADRFEAIGAIWEEIAAAEERQRVPPARAPEAGFAPCAYGWAAGADLEALYGDDDFSAGDFVRNCRQLLDLTRQIRDGFPRLAPAASAAITAVDRGIVAVGGRV
ncbi:MAG: DEAD/DEAH box helicase [Actinomycetota bacterium]